MGSVNSVMWEDCDEGDCDEDKGDWGVENNDVEM